MRFFHSWVFIVLCVEFADCRVPQETAVWPTAPSLWHAKPFVQQILRYGQGLAQKSSIFSQSSAYRHGHFRDPPPSPITVVLVFQSRGETDQMVRTHEVEMPLRKHLSPSRQETPYIPFRPHSARIKTVYATDPTLANLSDLEDHVVCYVYPVWTAEEIEMRGDQGVNAKRRRTPSMGSPIWFQKRDGEVDFINPNGRWFLEGRQIEGYHCI
ncbi:MAG: hypothetical protein M1819_006751 [Sarea resinae]|nr:MAG: hypothetical protein M1819_006751 [Sarea resinae]